MNGPASMKTLLITGASSGLGFETARAVARQGLAIVLTARDQIRAEATARSIRKETGNEQIHGMSLDLSSFQSTRSFADGFLARFPRIDILIANAGLLRSRYEESADGVELNLAVNHLGHFLLLNRLMPAIRGAQGPRIVLVGSDAHKRGRFDPARTTSRDGYRWLDAYASSKLAFTAFGLALARRLAPGSATVNLIHPGLSRTDIWPSGTWGDRVFSSMIRMFASPASRNALGIVRLALSPELEGITGRYFEKDRETPPLPWALAPESQQRVWEWSERATGERFATP